MQALMIFVGILSGGVSYFLLLAAAQMEDRQISYLKIFVAALLSGVYASICLMPAFAALSRWYWRLVVLTLSSILSFGFSLENLRCGLVYLLMQCSVAGLSVETVKTPVSTLLSLLSAIVLCLYWILRRKEAMKVELDYEGKKVSFTAMKDTGNTLKDPVSGLSVLIVSPGVAQRLTGLTLQQIKDPVHTLSCQPIKGLRLIPYRTIDRGEGMLLGLSIKQGSVGSRRGPVVIAFATEELDKSGNIEGLTGGTV